METIKFALRALRQSPGFTALAVLALGLGIGANSAIFSIINAIFLRPLPYEHAEQIVQVTSTEAERQLNLVAMSWPRLEMVR
jgi:putative ABC transport system permease protein